MPSITPSPPYMPPMHPAVYKHYQGARRHLHQSPPPPTVHNSHLGVGSTPHSTLQSSSSNQSSHGVPRPAAPHSNGGLNLSSQHSVGGNSGSVSPGTTGTGTRTTGLDQSRDNSHLTDLSHISRITPLPAKSLHLVDTSNTSSINSRLNNTTLNSNGPYHQQHSRMSNGHVKNSSELSAVFMPSTPRGLQQRNAVKASSRGLLHSLCLLSLISMVMAVIAFIFLLELSPVSGSNSGVYQEVTVALAAVCLVLDLACTLVCTLQFIFASKLHTHDSAEQYLRQSSATRVWAVTAFFLSVPLLLAGVVLHCVVSRQSTTAVTTAAIMALAVVACCAAMLHSLVIWRKHKRRPTSLQQSPPPRLPWNNLHSTSSPLPPATVDLSNPPQQELSTLV